MPSLDRREFLKLGGAATLGVALFPSKGAKALRLSPRIPLAKRLGETTSICSYCAGGCGVIISADGENIANIEGDPEHPINAGRLCSKGQALHQIRTVDGKPNPRRLTTVLYRAPNSTQWEEKDWDWALSEIANRIKSARDANWINKDKDGNPVNRTEAIAQVGGSAHDNEECYLISKMNRALGMVYTETQARI